jgi:hypothetical protein
VQGVAREHVCKCTHNTKLIIILNIINNNNYYIYDYNNIIVVNIFYKIIITLDMFRTLPD